DSSGGGLSVGLPIRTVCGKVSLGDELPLDSAPPAPFLAGEFCDDSTSATVGTAVGLAFFFPSDDFPPPAAARTWPAIFALFPVGFDARFGACAASFRRSATEGMRLPEMSLRIWSISAQRSRWPTPISGLRAAWRSRSSPESTSDDSRRPLARSADAW